MPDPRFFWAAVDIAGPKATDLEVAAVAARLERLNQQGSPLPLLCAHAARSREGVPQRLISAL
jgi:hypothetical protein